LGIEALRPWTAAITGVGIALVAIGAIGGVVAVIVRVRRSTDVERQQLRWFRYGASVTLLSVVVTGVFYETGQLEAALIVFSIGAAALPVTMGVAILRYRLYDIDRIVSRTVSYVLVTALLAGIYVLGVLGVGRVVVGATGGGSELVVAASTLAVAAAFRPVRNRVQRAVDRRFNRARYDATRTVETFLQRLRDEVDLETVKDEFLATAVSAVQPSEAHVWLPGEVR
jgi:hypothetical protein